VARYSVDNEVEHLFSLVALAVFCRSRDEPFSHAGHLYRYDADVAAVADGYERDQRGCGNFRRVWPADT